MNARNSRDLAGVARDTKSPSRVPVVRAATRDLREAFAGKVHRRVLRQSQTYMTSAGEVVVERMLYKDRKDADGRCVSPMELARKRFSLREVEMLATSKPQHGEPMPPEVSLPGPPGLPSSRTSSAATHIRPEM